MTKLKRKHLPILLWSVVAFLFIFPLSKLLVQPFIDSNTIELFEKIFKSTSIKKSIFQTLIFAISVTTLSTLLGVFFGWVITRTDLPFKNQFKSILSFPYAIPPFIGAIAWIFLANPSNGLLNVILDTKIFNIYSMTGLILVEMSFLYTFSFLNVTSALDNMDSSLEEAARVSGASPLKVFFLITLPLIKRSILSGSLMIFLACLASFGLPAMIGGPAGIKLLSTEIYFLQKMGTLSGLKQSVLTSGLLFTFSLLLVGTIFTFDKNKSASLVNGKSNIPSTINLGLLKWIFLTFVLSFIFVALFLPLSGILISALNSVQGEFQISNFTLNNFKRILFETDEVSRSILNSIKFGTLTALISVILSLSLAYTRTQILTKPKWRWIELFLALPFSMPGTILALALIISYSQNFLGLDFSIYNTIYMFLYAFILKYLHFSYKMIFENFSQIHPSLIEAAQVSGANKLKTFSYIWLPLLKPSIMASLFLIFVPCVSELTMSILLTGPGLETIGTTIFRLQEYSDNYGGGAASLSFIIIGLVILTNQLTKIFSKGKFGL